MNIGRDISPHNKQTSQSKHLIWVQLKKCVKC